MSAERNNRIATGNGVEYLRQATNVLELTTPRITSQDDLDRTKKSPPSNLEVGQIGITRQYETDKDTGIRSLKSDHVFIITDKIVKPDGKIEYRISESVGGQGITSRIIKASDNYIKRSEFYNVRPMQNRGGNDV